MFLTEQVLRKYRDPWTGRPIDPFAESEEDSDETSENSESESDENPYFDRDCPTNIAMLNIWGERFCEDKSCVTSHIPYFPYCHAHSQANCRFCKKAVRWELPLYVGQLEAIIHLTDPKWARAANSRRMIEGAITKYGQPRRIWESEYEDERPTSDCEDTNWEFWEENVPVIQF